MQRSTAPGGPCPVAAQQAPALAGAPTHVALRCGMVQAAIAIGIWLVQCRPVADQQLQRASVAAGCRPRCRRLAPCVPRSHVSARRQQSLCTGGQPGRRKCLVPVAFVVRCGGTDGQPKE